MTVFSVLLALSAHAVAPAPMPLKLENQACVYMDESKLGIKSTDVLMVDIDGKAFTQMQFVSKTGEVIESWPLFEGVDILRWSKETFAKDVQFVVFKSEQHACEVVQVK